MFLNRVGDNRIHQDRETYRRYVPESSLWSVKGDLYVFCNFLKLFIVCEKEFHNKKAFSALRKCRGWKETERKMNNKLLVQI